jgi:ATP-dependent DNA helicase RecG
MKESQQTEWKQTWRDEYLRWICGFANAQGGTLCIGKNDNGEVVGLPDASRLLVEIPNKVRDLLGIVVEVNLHSDHGKDWLEIRVDPYPSPISYRGEFHYRSGSTKQELKGVALQKFMLRTLGRHWDDVPLPNFLAADCNPDTVQKFKTKGVKFGRLAPSVAEESLELLFEKLQLTEGDHLKRAAALLFSKDPERWFTGAYIKVGFFFNNHDLRYQDLVKGNLFEQVDAALELIHFKYLKASIRYERTQRIESYPFPEAGLREALLNAVVHKDYGSGIPIQISVYEDHLVLWNPGELPEHWTLERLMGKHPSKPYNPLIAHVFFLAGYIESWGRGIEKIASACMGHGIAVPEFDSALSGLTLTFRASEEYLALIRRPEAGQAPPAAPEATGEKGSVETTQKAREATAQKTTQKTAQKILELLRTNPSVGRGEIAAQLGDITEDGVKYHLNKLKTEGRIRRIGPDKGGHWEVLKTSGNENTDSPLSR